MKKAGKLIKLKHPNVVFNECLADAANLLLKDIFKLDLFAEVLKKAAKIVKFTSIARSCSHPETSATKIDEERRIVSPSIYEMEHQGCPSTYKADTQTLAVLKADACSNSMIIHEFIGLRKAPEYNVEIAGLVGTTVQEEIRKLIESRRKFIRPPSDSTTITYLMDLSKSFADLPNDGPADSESDTSLGENPHVGPLRDAVAKAVQLSERFGLPPSVSPAAFPSDLLRFIKKKKTWTDVQREDASQTPSLDWWTLDIEFSLLHNIAENILSIPTSPAASERLWSVHDFTHSKLRNRLKVATVEKLSFIYTNSGDTRSPTMPVNKSTTRLREPDSDSEDDLENDDFLFDFNDLEFEYLLDAT
ncbi:hypothetical protein PHMEG_00014828, partial [Phytophthora megakarya]